MWKKHLLQFIFYAFCCLLYNLFYIVISLTALTGQIKVVFTFDQSLKLLVFLVVLFWCKTSK